MREKLLCRPRVGRRRVLESRCYDEFGFLVDAITSFLRKLWPANMLLFPKKPSIFKRKTTRVSRKVIVHHVSVKWLRIMLASPGIAMVPVKRQDLFASMAHWWEASPAIEELSRATNKLEKLLANLVLRSKSSPHHSYYKILSRKVETQYIKSSMICPE
ncbi:unnamed protein product [Albugo candida]|uniref:Uncharacterized protein n=1 Tax=Albugo candida TaxID=65357 RepID=A0A024FUL0_9STRA|nr:unnamed protein product [Albugo candida]|eukprot:CCI10726.1 unnamed protein product [Albugo candida]